MAGLFNGLFGGAKPAASSVLAGDSGMFLNSAPQDYI